MEEKLRQGEDSGEKEREGEREGREREGREREGGGRGDEVKRRRGERG